MTSRTLKLLSSTQAGVYCAVSLEPFFVINAMSLRLSPWWESSSSNPPSYRDIARGLTWPGRLQSASPKTGEMPSKY